MFKKTYILFLFFIGVIFSLINLSSCRYSERYYEGGDISLTLSKDTVRFDTVFTTVGSATRSFKIMNPLNETLLISKVSLQNQESSFFRINVNGRNGDEVDNVEIPPRDSVYVFAEVTVDPDMPLTSSPFVIEEYVNIDVNGNQQRVLLEAWGQNANYIPSTSSKGGLALLSCSNDKVTWDDPKPYVIYGILLIDSCTLELPPD